jgi:hypothetical protein
VASVVEAGAEMLVAGSAIFEPGKTEKNARSFLKLARAAAPGGGHAGHAGHAGHEHGAKWKAAGAKAKPAGVKPAKGKRS